MFAFRLAKELGRVNVDRMLRQLTLPQFVEWLAYAELEPFGERRGDYRAALITQTITNMNRDTKKHPQPFQLEEFLLDFGDGASSRKKQTPEMQKSILMAIAVGWSNTNG